MTSRPHRVVMVAYPGAQVLDVTGPLEVFSRTSRWLADTHHRAAAAYQTEMVGPCAGPIPMSQSLELVARRSWRDVTEADTLLVAGGVGAGAAQGDAGL